MPELNGKDSAMTSSSRQDDVSMGEFPLLGLGDDVLGSILSFLSARDIASCACTCARLRELASSDEKVWLPACQRRWGQKTRVQEWCTSISASPRSSEPGPASASLENPYRVLYNALDKWQCLIGFWRGVGVAHMGSLVGFQWKRSFIEGVRILPARESSYAVIRVPFLRIFLSHAGIVSCHLDADWPTHAEEMLTASRTRPAPRSYHEVSTSYPGTASSLKGEAFVSGGKNLISEPFQIRHMVHSSDREIQEQGRKWCPVEQSAAKGPKVQHIMSADIGVHGDNHIVLQTTGTLEHSALWEPTRKSATSQEAPQKASQEASIKPVLGNPQDRVNDSPVRGPMALFGEQAVHMPGGQKQGIQGSVRKVSSLTDVLRGSNGASRDTSMQASGNASMDGPSLVHLSLRRESSSPTITEGFKGPSSPSPAILEGFNGPSSFESYNTASRSEGSKKKYSGARTTPGSGSNTGRRGKNSASPVFEGLLGPLSFDSYETVASRMEQSGGQRSARKQRNKAKALKEELASHTGMRGQVSAAVAAAIIGEPEHLVRIRNLGPSTRDRPLEGLWKGICQHRSLDFVLVTYESGGIISCRRVAQFKGALENGAGEFNPTVSGYSRAGKVGAVRWTAKIRSYIGAPLPRAEMQGYLNRRRFQEDASSSQQPAGEAGIHTIQALDSELNRRSSTCERRVPKALYGTDGGAVVNDSDDTIIGAYKSMPDAASIGTTQALKPGRVWLYADGSFGYAAGHTDFIIDYRPVCQHGLLSDDFTASLTNYL